MARKTTKREAKLLRMLRGEIAMSPEDIIEADEYMRREKARVLAARTRLHNDYQTTGVDGPRMVKTPTHWDL